MAIRLEVQPYCSECCDFEADVIKPEKTVRYDEEHFLVHTHQTDTIVRCKNAKRCEAIKRYLVNKTKEDK